MSKKTKKAKQITSADIIQKQNQARVEILDLVCTITQLKKLGTNDKVCYLSRMSDVIKTALSE